MREIDRVMIHARFYELREHAERHALYLQAIRAQRENAARNAAPRRTFAGFASLLDLRGDFRRSLKGARGLA